MDTNDNFERILYWLQTEAPFRGQTDPVFINAILNLAKNDVETAKKLITKYYAAKKRIPDLMKARDLQDERCQKAITLGVISTDVGRPDDVEFPVVVVANLGKSSREYGLYESTNIAINVCFSLMLSSKRIQNYGAIAIIDCSNIPYFLMSQATPSFFMKIISCLHVTISSAVIQVHVINAGLVTRTIIKATRLLLPSYINDILYVHDGSWDCLSIFIPSECLPVEYGGCSGTVQENIRSTLEAAVHMRDFILENDKYGFDIELH